jgi:hypothetical protein
VLLLGQRIDVLEALLCGADSAGCYYRCVGDIEDRSGRLSQCLLGPGIDCESPHPCECIALHDNNPVAGMHLLLEDLIACDVAGIESAPISTNPMGLIPCRDLIDAVRNA